VATRSARSPLHIVPDDHLTWHHITVDGRVAVYGAGGDDGPPVLFLHGWALGSQAYKRALRRLVTRGCRVFAPALPSFGGTANLPGAEMNIAGYARWVAAFMAEVGIEEPALVIGHSFGGGVAIALARNHPQLVRFLILLNALGSGARQWPWEWAVGFGTEFWPPAGAIDVIQAMRADLVPNVVRNPLGVLRVGLLAMSTDLRSEMEELKGLGVPALALTSEGDRLIPRSAFETISAAVGADRRVVSGRHSWLLVDPDSFAEVLASTVDLQVAEHAALRAADRKEEIELLLARSHLSPRDIRTLVDGAAPLWLLSDAPSTLAGDLLLCRPQLRPDEVRAVARRVEGSKALRITIVAKDRPGLLADSAAVLTASGLSIASASASTWRRPAIALHSFIVDIDAELASYDWERLGGRLRAMVSTRRAPSTNLAPSPSAAVTVQGIGERSVVKVAAPDEPGLLTTICRFFQLQGLNIETLQARTTGGVAHDTFIVLGTVDVDGLRELLRSGGELGATDPPAGSGFPSPEGRTATR
jgi:pimeloyl-ACP methyl ester carboxylesterase/glycine cleavage system regulatory protein